MSSQLGHTLGHFIWFGANTFTYYFVTKELQLPQFGMGTLGKVSYLIVLYRDGASTLSVVSLEGLAVSSARISVEMYLDS